MDFQGISLGNKKVSGKETLYPNNYLLCAEGLSSLIYNVERAQLLLGLKVMRIAPMITH